MSMKYQLENFKGSYDFRCKFHDGWEMESHLHEYSELLYCQSGDCEVVVNGRLITLPQKYLIWLPPNYIHQYRATDAQLICAVFSKDHIPAFFHLLGNKRLKVAPVAAEELEELLERLPFMKEEGPLQISGCLNLIGAKVMKQSAWEQECVADELLYQKVITYLSTHFQEDISLKSVARHFGYNEKYLSHSLHSLTGIHFSKLLSLYRIEYAQKLLREQMITVSQVAAESGFSAINTFNRTFKETVGKCPLEYRKASRK
jgi:AraC-like DNA-binding protein